MVLMDAEKHFDRPKIDGSSGDADTVKVTQDVFDPNASEATISMASLV